MALNARKDRVVRCRSKSLPNEQQEVRRRWDLLMSEAMNTYSAAIQELLNDAFVFAPNGRRTDDLDR